MTIGSLSPTLRFKLVIVITEKCTLTSDDVISLDKHGREAAQTAALSARVEGYQCWESLSDCGVSFITPLFFAGIQN